MFVPARDFPQLMQRIAEDDPDAFTQLFHHYNPILLAQLRSRLKKIPCLRSRFDPEDLAQDFWIVLIAGPLRRRHFPTPDHFLHYLARTARNKIRKVVRDHLLVQKRDARRRQFLSETGAGAAAAGLANLWPMPAWIAEFRDDCERWLLTLTAAQRQVPVQLRAIVKPVEIARALRDIERMRGRIHRTLAII